ncbi:MAG: radical SAM family heme chaperone HemW [Nitrospira sp.]|nr:radical SAM family heme chaperone HemW [Nitrospira sp.]
MQSRRDIGIYLHIPFCRQRCHFCAFYLEVAGTDRSMDRIDAFHLALAQEIELHRRQDSTGGRPLQSVYFGGGTPTALPATRLVSVLQLVRTAWPLQTSAEITVEAHPSTVTPADLKVLADAGFSRISFGAESMDEQDFAPIGRPGRVQDTETAVEAARAAGFANISLDLMYGLPGQSLESWTHTVRSLLLLEPSHISCYALTIEDGTKLSRNMTLNLVPKIDEALQVAMESAAETLLSEAGFIRYEISNYAKPGFACRHNLLYWTDGDYLGLGPSAQSYVNGARFGNVADLTAYEDMLADHRLPVTERTDLSAFEQQQDALIFGLRLLRGVPLNRVPNSEQHNKIHTLIEQGLLESTTDRIRLTPLGRRYADTVAGELF